MMLKRAAFLSLLWMAVLGKDVLAQATGDPEAAALFDKMVETFRKATTLHLVCKAHFKAEGFEADVRASLLMKEGNRMRLEVDIKGTKDGQPYTHGMRMISNGSFIRNRENDGAWSDYVTTKNWNETILLNVLRGGFPTGLELERIKDPKANSKEDAGIAFFPLAEPMEFVLWKKEELSRREVTPIEFKVKRNSAFFKENAVILWLDAKSKLPVKRMNIIQSDRTLNVTEIYETVSLNDAIDDSRFEQPKDR